VEQEELAELTSIGPPTRAAPPSTFIIGTEDAKRFFSSKSYMKTIAKHSPHLRRKMTWI